MRKYLVLISVMFLFACGRKETTQSFVPPEASEINEVVRAVIEQDSLSAKDVPLDIALKKLQVVFIAADKNGVPSAPDWSVFSIKGRLP
ncbi:hypothetical protein [Mucilaginibacter psychrotolerans]|uniref:Uncharacterized protein n=1 Tax=Mucilaginibacter psychrotolerans TaxID=1524096 RepID=A0A4Y8S4M3_9SPHI|nr:hypothetical protein [Mucilaginibacter psychrotolerans]TFF33888.1 hypothetical protein E2R66_23715 [Mucilaginibacter psychrotolerans]